MKNKKFTRFTAVISSFVIAGFAIFNFPLISYADTAATAAAPVAWPAAPAISAGSAILIDADTGAILYDKDSHTKAYPASITKLMTGLLTVENCSMDEIVTFSQAAANSVIVGVDANNGTKTGEQYTVEQALYTLLLKSANEVAYGLAEHVGDSLPNFVDMMNARAKELGALDTHFNNASGLFDSDHYTTAYDMALIGRAAFTNAAFLTIDSYPGTYNLAPTNLTPEVRSFHSTNLMFKGQKFYYQYCKGGKTGFTDESQYTLVSYAEKDGMRLICVTMKEATADNRYIDTKALFEYGFNNFKKVSVANSDLSSIFNSSNYYNSAVYGNNSVNFSMDASYVDIPASVNLSNIGMSLDTGANSADSETSATDSSNYSVKLNFTYSNHIVGSANLIFNTSNTAMKVSNLPYLEDNNNTTPVPRKCFVINVWYLVIAVVILLIALKIFDEIHHSKKRTLRNRNKKSKLHY